MSFNMSSVLASCEEKIKQYKMLVRGVADGRIQNLVVQGPPGVGKSYEAEQILDAAEMGKRIKYQRSAGHTTPLAMYNALHLWRGKNSVLLFDDCDDAFKDKKCLNILKAATDTRSTRNISWGSTSRLVVAQEFMYEGRLIILTNENLNQSKYGALRDRVLLFDLNLTAEERVARIITVLRSDTTHPEYHDEVMSWLIDRYALLGKNLTIRSALKAMKLCAMNHDCWRDLADLTICEGE